MITSDIIKDAQSFLMNTYSRQPLVLVKGRGTTVYDSDGREYLDFVAGVAVNNLGHCHPKVVVALQKQAQRLMHVSNHFHIEAQVALGKELVRNSFADKAFFCNSGTEAIEAAIKLSRRYSREIIKKDRFEVITMFGSFHGRTYGAVSATAQEKFHQGFEPMVPGFRYVPFNDSKAVEDAVTDKTCAILVEPVQGEGGVKVPSPGYLKALRKICDEHQLLLVLDEIQTGMGRTGRLFAYEHEGITPDIMALAKGLGSGMPVGALLATDKASQAFVPGTHGSTFGGNPLACAAGLASLETLLEDNIIIQNVEALGKHFMDGLRSLKAKYPFIKDVRGQGLLIGMELDFEGKEIVTECLKQGFLINCTVNTVLRFMPPLIISEEEIDQLIDALDGIFQKR
ncbi:MAG: argD [Nitrospirae bacterium]|jgi:predicted acetylornithine/succinylornithine family transaminase|nr:argD [Nitrospirota bacterium]